ncbi:hypothetical protein GGI12_006329, partial [Dipsacomyces acuminosporus]
MNVVNCALSAFALFALVAAASALHTKRQDEDEWLKDFQRQLEELGEIQSTWAAKG